MVKIFKIVLMVVAPIISGWALYEYLNVKYMNHAPSYPFGKTFANAIIFKNIKYLSNYPSQMLSIGVVFLVITILIYIITLIKSLIKLAFAALFLMVLYFLYYYFYKI